MTPRELTPDLALELAKHLCEKDRREVLGSFPDLESWARSRVERGVAWALVDEAGHPIAAGGIERKNASTGLLWLAGVDGWAMPYAIHAVRVIRDIIASGLYERFECECAVDRPEARRFVEYLGFRELYVADGFVHYATGVKK